jgi:hypothetical protein
MKPFLHWRLLPCAMAALFFCPTLAQAQDEEEEERGPEVKADGMEYFRHKLHEAGMRPLRNWTEALNNPQRTVIVLLGDRSIRQYLTWEIHAAVQRGAAILIATDRSTQGTKLEEYFSLRVTGEMVTTSLDGCFQGKSGRGKPFHPFVHSFGAPLGVQEDSPMRMFHELGRTGPEALATNYPSILQVVPNRWPRPEPLAGYPFGAWKGKDENDKLETRRDIFAAGGRFEHGGRYLVLADHSIFLNQMLLAYSEETGLLNSNLQFTIDCIDWLKGDERDRCLFVEDGEVKTDFELHFPENKDSDLDRILKLLMFLEANGNGNKIVTKAQDADLFNSLLKGFVSTREIIRALVIILVCLSIFYLFWMTIRNRATTDPARLLVTPELAAMIPRGDVLRQRFDSMQEIDNVYEAARQLIRDFLSGLDAEPDERGLPPRLVVEDGYEDEEGLRRKIARLWRIAYDSAPVPVAPESWSAIKDDLKEILADADDGWWKFVKRRMKDEG